MKTVKILHFSTHYEDCGIGKYQEMFLESMGHIDGVENKFFDLSPNIMKVMSEADVKKSIQQLKKELKDYDALHVQHEFSFYTRDGFLLVAQAAKEVGKPLIITEHTSPNIAHTKPVLGGIGPRSVLRYAKAVRRERIFDHEYSQAMRLADRVIVHNDVTKNALIELGVKESAIRKLVIPVPIVDQSKKSSVIKKALAVKEGDVVYSTVGFLHRFKGLKEAIKALKLLPDNYKLAIIGGMHMYSDTVDFYDEITDLILQYNLQDRVYIAGYIEEDDELNALVRETDMVVYPYDNYYYSNVSSAALNNAFANYMPVIAYPTKSFMEIARLTDGGMTLTDTFSYYELAREIKNIDVEKARQASKKFAIDYLYEVVAKQLAAYYNELV